jgi:hypothetical protein
MDAINGISLERYAALCAKMNDVIKDDGACVRIAESEGIAGDDWMAAHKGWQAKMQDISDMGRTATQFVPLWQSELEKLNGPAKEPCTFEEFAQVQAAMSNNLNPDREAVLRGCGLTMEQWQQWNSYWAPKMAADMNLQGKLMQIMQRSM